MQVLLTYRYIYFISNELTNIVGLKEEDIDIAFRDLLKIINEKKSLENISLIFNKISKQEGLVDKGDIEKWLDEQLKHNSYSVIKQKLRKEENDLKYSIESGHRERKRNT